MPISTRILSLSKHRLSFFTLHGFMFLFLWRNHLVNLEKGISDLKVFFFVVVFIFSFRQKLLLKITTKKEKWKRKKQRC
jgi:hypothetical protein